MKNPQHMDVSLAAIRIAYIALFGADLPGDLPFSKAGDHIIAARPNDWQDLMRLAESCKGEKDASGNYLAAADVAEILKNKLTAALLT